MRVLLILISLLLIGCNTEEKPIYLDCHTYAWDDTSEMLVKDYRSIILIDKQNGLLVEKDLTPELPKKYQYLFFQLHVEDKYYGYYDGDYPVLLINRFTLEVTEDFPVDECVVSENQYPEVRAEAIKIYKDQTTPKI